MLENAAESHTSGARFVRRFALCKTRWLKRDATANIKKVLHTSQFLAMTNKHNLQKR